jgi:membrane-associated protein
VEKLIDSLIHAIPAPLALALVFALPALEASAFVGVVFPGEIAVVLGGVLANQGQLNLGLTLLAAVAGAVIGDQVGYVVGARWGATLLRKLPDRILDDEKLEKSREYLARMGAKGVVLGRWTAALRALIPGLAGMSSMPYGRFALANVVGGTIWAVTFVLVGYLAGSSYTTILRSFNAAGYVLLGLVAAGLLVAWVVHKRRAREKAPDAS